MKLFGHTPQESAADHPDQPLWPLEYQGVQQSNLGPYDVAVYRHATTGHEVAIPTRTGFDFIDESVAEQPQPGVFTQENPLEEEQ
ncbi:MAG TPA: hypothetical protein VHT70_00365 [Candidatus Saccharimonadales bacterium]|jgi:hypothetical protein|nr:hypothetical protein [Candidatus Saccharimonadales bacterium]